MMEEDSEMTSIALPGVLNSKMNNSQLSACISNGSYSNRSPSPAQTQKDSIAKSLTNFDIEVIRIIAQHLRYLGLNRTFDVLASESGCTLEDPNASKLRANVLSGQWDQAERDLEILQGTLSIPQSDLIKMKFLLFEQQYMEVLEAGDLYHALDILRKQITPLKYNVEHAHKLSSYLMCSSPEELYQMSKWPGKGPMSRSTLLDSLQAFLPTSLMVPPKRLLTLLNQSLECQVSRCRLHNTNISTGLLDSLSLLSDHLCSGDDFPSHTTQILTDHLDEVWFCRFSPNGKMLATGSKDGKFIIYDVDEESFKVTLRSSYDGPQVGISYFAWSPDSTHLAICGPDETADLNIWNVETGTKMAKLNQSVDDRLTYVSWYPEGTRLACGGTKGHFYSCKSDGHLNSAWEGLRVLCLACLKDNKTVVAADTHHRIRGYNVEDHLDVHLFSEEGPIISFAFDSSESRVLVNVQNQGVNMWDMRNKCRMKRFRGVVQKEFSIYSCFGGLNEDFVASGSEDQKVVIWHVSDEQPLVVMSEHSGTVNCVHWNPTLPSMLASASDDGTVRIWGPSCRAQVLDYDAESFTFDENPHHRLSTEEVDRASMGSKPASV